MPVDDILKELNSIRNRAVRSVQMVRTRRGLDSARSRYLGRSGQISSVIAEIEDLTPDARPLALQTAQSVKAAVIEALNDKEEDLKAFEQERMVSKESIDVTLPAGRSARGRRHLLSAATRRIIDLFTAMGFAAVSSPEIESEYNNFEALNIPKLHPVRDLHEAFSVGRGLVLRTHMAPALVRILLQQKPPLAAVCAGRVYRRHDTRGEAHVSRRAHAILVGESVGFGALKGVLDSFLRELFGPQVDYRLRPVYQPFTEPTCEVDVRGPAPDEDAEGGDWTPVMQGGMIHPRVFEEAGHDPLKISGFALSLEIESLARLIFGTDAVENAGSAADAISPPMAD